MKETIQEINSALENGNIHSQEHVNRVLLLAVRDLIHSNLEQTHCWKWTLRLAIGTVMVILPFMAWASVIVAHAMIETGWKPF